MSKIAIVYFSSTGNTYAMAQAVAEGATKKGAEVELIEAENFDTSRLSEFDAIGFGCPAMGVEVLEESTFEPMFASVESSLNGKKVGLFGSYGWGDGTWMHNWYDRTVETGANVVAEGVIANNMPGADELAECVALGNKLA